MSNNKPQIKEGLPSMLKRFTDDFFDGLKMGAINRALEKAKRTKELPPPVVQKLIDIDNEVRELEKTLKKYEK